MGVFERRWSKTWSWQFSCRFEYTWDIILTSQKDHFKIHCRIDVALVLVWSGLNPAIVFIKSHSPLFSFCIFKSADLHCAAEETRPSEKMLVWCFLPDCYGIKVLSAPTCVLLSQVLSSRLFTPLIIPFHSQFPHQFCLSGFHYLECTSGLQSSLPGHIRQVLESNISWEMLRFLCLTRTSEGHVGRHLVHEIFVSFYSWYHLKVLFYFFILLFSWYTVFNVLWEWESVVTQSGAAPGLDKLSDALTLLLFSHRRKGFSFLFIRSFLCVELLHWLEYRYFNIRKVFYCNI